MARPLADKDERERIISIRVRVCMRTEGYGGLSEGWEVRDMDMETGRLSRRHHCVVRGG